MKILRLENISKSFGDHSVLRHIDFSVEENEIVSLLGISGAGKSTIFNIIAGSILPDTGDVFLNDELITGKKATVSYMLQKDLLLPHMNILDNVSLPLRIKNVKKEEARSIAESYFEDFGLDGMEYKYPSQLSGGMRQRAALLRTYLNKKPIILLDEPFSALDLITKSKLHLWFLDIVKKYHMTAIFISHDIEEAIYLSDRVLILSTEGVIAKEINIDRRDRNEDFKLSEEFLNYKRIISKELK